MRGRCPAPGPHVYDPSMARQLQPLNRCRTWITLAIISATLGLAAELGHMQWTSGGPSGLRGRGIPFDAKGIATWREAGISLSRGFIGVWSVERTVAKESYDWGGGGAAFFGVHDEMGGPPQSEGTVRWVPLVRFAGSGTPPTAAKGATFFTLPLWPLTAIFLLGAAIAYRRAAFGPSRCAGCGYDLRGIPNRNCPECGTTTPTPH